MIRLKGQVVYDWRLDRGLSQEQAATECGIAMRTYRRIEDGELVRALSGARVAREMGVNLDAIKVS